MDDSQLSPSAVAAAAPDGQALGDYLLGERLERRAAADVYAARHARTRALRLVYVLRPGAMQDAPLMHRVVYEADAAHWVRHPAAAKVEAYGETPSRRLYVAVERPAGRTLAEVLAQRGALSPPTLVRLAYRLVEALDEAHTLGLAHGWLTPRAVVVADALEVGGGAPLVTLTGLGVAAVLHGGAAPTGRVAVSGPDALYLSPERRAGAEPDVAGDVFALAGVLHHALTGAPPAGGVVAWGAHARAVAVLAAARAPEPRHRHAGVKALWDDFLAALVAGESSDALREAAGQSAWPAPVARPVPVAPATPAPLATPPGVAAPPPARSRRRGSLGSITAAGAGLVTTGLLLAHGAVLRAGTPAAHAAAGRATPAAAAPSTLSAVVPAAPAVAAPAVPRDRAAARPAPRTKEGAGRGGAGEHDAGGRNTERRDAAGRGPEASKAQRVAEPAAPAINVPSVIILQVGGNPAAPTPTRPGEFTGGVGPNAPH